MNCLITGGSGFIGSNLTLALRNAGHRVISVDLQAPRFVQPDVYIPGDITTKGLLESVLRSHQIQIVIHLAAVATIQDGASDREKTIRTNLGGTDALLEALDATGNQAMLIHASTDKVYGLLEAGHQYTEDMPLSPLSGSPYDWSKAAADTLVMDWLSASPEHKGIILRFCNIYGPFDLHTSRVVPRSISAMCAGGVGTIHYYTDHAGATQPFRRDLLYVDDLCRVFLTILNRMESGTHLDLLGNAFNLGTGECVSMETVVCSIASMLSPALPPERRISRYNDEIPVQSMDFSKAQRMLGFTPSVSLTKGLEETVLWWQHYLSSQEAES